LTSAALGNDKLLWSANYGFQKRIFNHWYLDYKMGLGFYKADRYVYSPILTIIPKDKWRVDLINQFSIGYTFGSGKHKNINSCDIFRCFEEEKSLWKIDVRQIFNNNQYYLSSYLMTGYEQKLGNSAWSLNTELKGGFSRYSGSSPNFRYNSYSVSATIEPRYYYNLKKRISTGLSVNNLSGCYISLAMTKGYGKSVFSGKYYPSNEEFKGRYEEQPLFIIPKWGIQKRIFKHGFADFSLAPIRFNKTFYDNTYNSVQNNTKSKGSTQSWQYSTIGKIPVPIADFKIGFAF
jgi:hypothetical protein